MLGLKSGSLQQSNVRTSHSDFNLGSLENSRVLEYVPVQARERGCLWASAPSAAQCLGSHWLWAGHPEAQTGPIAVKTNNKNPTKENPAEL